MKISKKSITNKLIKILCLILAAIILYIVVSFKLHKDAKSTQAFKLSPETHTVASKDWTEQIDLLQTKLKQDASINVLEGTTEIEKVYTNEDTTTTGNPLKWLAQKLNNLNSQTLTVHTYYKFGFAYNIRDLRIEDLGEGNIKIDLYRGDLDLKYIEELSDKRELSDAYGILGKTLTPQETSSLMQRTYMHVFNTVQNDVKIRDKAMEYAKSTIEGLAIGFGFKKVEIDALEDNLIDNEEVEIKGVE